MSVKAGDYLGGVRDLETLRERCRIDRATGCWVFRIDSWRKTDRVSIRIIGVNSPLNGRRAALHLAGVEIKPGNVVVPKATCLDPACCNPEHSKQISAAEFKSRTSRGRKRSAATLIRAAAACPNRKPSWMVDWVLESEQPAQDVAHAMGLDYSTVQKWRNGTRRKFDRYGMFSALLAA